LKIFQAFVHAKLSSGFFEPLGKRRTTLLGHDASRSLIDLLYYRFSAAEEPSMPGRNP